MNCYLWELEALLEGIALREIDKQEKEAIFGFNLRYILNAKKPKLSKVINKKKLEEKIKKIFRRETTQQQSTKTKKVIDALNHFKNRGE